ncbi:hypothetical protein MMC30_007009 [Trapelia coarctata]|nr:hypothetical protein [Trapelia coarctata]
MVFKPFSHLARQSFTKSITHGYAQSVVAATQSSYASSTTQFPSFTNHSVNRFGKPGTNQLRDAFQNASSSSSSNNKNNFANSSTDTANDGGLDAYYAAWQNQQRAGDGIEWQQFQFAKRIGWKPPSAVFEGKGKDKEEDGLRSEAELEQRRRGVDRAYTASTVDDIKKAENQVAEAAAIASVDEAIASEIVDIQKSSSDVDQNFTVPPVAVGDCASHVTQKSAASPVTAISGGDETSQHAETQFLESSSVSARPLSPMPTPIPDQTGSANSLDDVSRSYFDRLGQLCSARNYAEIPPVFEAMLRAGVHPSVTAYNALLAAAVHLPADKHQVVPKVLDVYSDMLGRKVSPSTETYTIVLNALSFRALEVSRLRNALRISQQRFGAFKEASRFMFRSQEAESDILAEDDSLDIAIRLFDSSTTASQSRVYSASTYRLLLEACAAHGETETMIRIHLHMEANKVVPYASIYPTMIKAFTAASDLCSARECFDGYKSLAIAHNNGAFSVLSRDDDSVETALIKAYAVCDKQDGATKLFEQIMAHRTERGLSAESLHKLRDTIILDAFVQACLDKGNFMEALNVAEELDMTAAQRNRAMVRICATAADSNDIDTATKAYQQILPATKDASTAAIAMLAMHIRHSDVESARSIWSTISAMGAPTNSFIEPTAMYTVVLIGGGNVDEGLMQARQSFARIRSSLTSSNGRSEITEQMDEAIEVIGSFLAEKAVVPSPQASMNFMWAMIENGGLVPSVAEQLLAGLGPVDVESLSWQDLTLALQVEAGIVINEQATYDIAHSARFAHLLETSLSSRMPLDDRTSVLVERCLTKIGQQRPDLVAQWSASKMPAAQPILFTPQPTPVAATPRVYNANFDPYATLMDHRGSAIIVEELEKQGSRGGSNLNEALARLRNIRRAGRHPRYIAYAKLITAAAKDGRSNLIHEILGMARHDMPLLTQYSVVRHGWVSILDAMVGACLTTSNRRMAAVYHQELLDMGAAPSANTFGLYITTLSGSTKTFDEATEAVRIFLRAMSEGVEPSSFLYNTLIGKLAKARRIDDCLTHFSDMHKLGVRPTSVTYGTIVNAACRVSDERLAEQLFDEMETMPNYQPRTAPYNTMMQFFLTTKRDSVKVLEYYHRMLAKNIQPSAHTYKLLIDTYATLEPINMAAAEGVLETIRSSGLRPEANHYASLIHAKGCALHDMAGARQIFDGVFQDTAIRPHACLYQAVFESMVANHHVKETGPLLQEMAAKGVEMTPYIANTLIHGWAMEKEITQATYVYESIGKAMREPSTYEAMTRAFLAVEDRDHASEVVREMLSRGYPSAVSGKILELLGHGMSRSSSVLPTL